ncbi:MAG: hypothetical protein ACKOYG_07425, partial [Ilumatobacteraceae bacterium]
RLPCGDATPGQTAAVTPRLPTPVLRAMSAPLPLALPFAGGPLFSFLAARAVARTVLSRLAERHGEPSAAPVAGVTRLFPSPLTLAVRAMEWQPWRSYAMHHLWSSL